MFKLLLLVGRLSGIVREYKDEVSFCLDILSNDGSNFGIGCIWIFFF